MGALVTIAEIALKLLGLSSWFKEWRIKKLQQKFDKADAQTPTRTELEDDLKNGKF